MLESATELLALGQQVLQQSGPDQPTVCFAAVPLLVPAAVMFARAMMRRRAVDKGRLRSVSSADLDGPEYASMCAQRGRGLV